MIYSGTLNTRKCEDANPRLAKIEGYLDDYEARETLAEFMCNNIYFTTHLLTGIKLFPFQESVIRSMLVKDFFLLVAGRGLSKSFMAAVFCFLYCILYPGSNVGLLSASFRQARLIFEYIEKFAKGSEGNLLQQCFIGEPSHKTEIYKMKIGASTISALPLGKGGKLRGFRFTAIVIDELLLLPENIVNEVIMPFISVNADPTVRKEVTEREDKLVAEGLMKEIDRTVFQNPKFIGLSSASYKFEFLYKIYAEYLEKIYDPNPKNEAGERIDTAGYGVMKFSYQIAPKFLYNDETISKFKQQFSEAAFNREFLSIFTDDSGGFFSKKKMDLCTIENGKSPTVEISGETRDKYLLAIDPSWSKAESSDHFAMCVMKLDAEKRHAIVVHNYAIAGGQFQDHCNYLAYLMQNFNMQYVIIDNAGSWFIDDCNASATFKDKKLELHFFEADFDNPNYVDGVRRSKRSYNSELKKICHAQYADNDWNRKANERLGANFDHRSVKFASMPMDSTFEKMMKLEVDIDHLYYDTDSKSLEGSGKKADFIEHQGDMINLVKSETALIEIGMTDNGRATFKLPSSIKRDDSPNRVRRDSYSALVLGSWGAKCYFDMLEETRQKSSFVPFFIQ